MQPDMTINRLCMRVDPGDSSYTPSLVVMKAGDSIHNLKEIRTIPIPASETVVTLLSNMTEVCQFVLILEHNGFLLEFYNKIVFIFKRNSLLKKYH